MPRDSGPKREVRPDEFEDIARSLSMQVGLLLKRANKSPCTPPLYLLITDADDKTVLETRVDLDGLELLSDPDAPLRARYPVTVSLTDRYGNTWEAVFTAPGQKDIQ
jgi:hypothetical protein